MIFGKVGETIEGFDIIKQIYLDGCPELDESAQIVCTESRSPTTNPWDWDCYSGEFTNPYKHYFLVEGEYYPENTKEVTLWHKYTKRFYYKIDVYKEGKLVNTYYK